jgi:D-inositol-3-phosphate glycosyltransferase
VKISLLTGGADTPYSLGLLSALISKNISVDFIANDEMSRADIVNSDKVSLFNLRGDQNPQVSFVQKAFRVLLYYIRLIKYAARSDSKLFHIQWFNKFLLFDRTLLNLYYKFLGKRLVFTAHNIDEQQRDGNKNILNQLSLKILYNLVDHIFVHTIKMKKELIQDFNIKVNKVTVIPFGINNTLPRTHSTRADARNALGLQDYHKILLFFGNIAPYKGLAEPETGHQCT